MFGKLLSHASPTAPAHYAGIAEEASRRALKTIEVMAVVGIGMTSETAEILPLTRAGA